jgi:RNA polymerase sigma-70 factor (ECF subfamily)
VNWESAWEGTSTEPAEGWEVEAVRRARRGDREAYGRLVEALWVDLVGLARGVLASDLHAEDLVQETLVHAWSRLGSLREESRFGAWVRRSLVRRCWRQLRADRRHHAAAAGLPHPAATAGDPTARLSVERALAALSPRQRAVVYLTAVEGRSDREIAAVLGLFPATVRVHRMRAGRRLRMLFGERS